MQKKERYQRRPGSRRTEDISGDSADGVNTNQFANITFFGQNFCNRESNIGSKCNNLLCRWAPVLGPTILKLLEASCKLPSMQSTYYNRTVARFYHPRWETPIPSLTFFNFMASISKLLLLLAIKIPIRDSTTTKCPMIQKTTTGWRWMQCPWLQLTASAGCGEPGIDHTFDAWFWVVLLRVLRFPPQRKRKE